MIKRADILASGRAMVMPGVVTWLFFYGIPGSQATAWLYSAMKVFMIAFPWLYAVRRLPQFRLPTQASVKLGVGFGVALFVATLVVYWFLRDGEVFVRTAPLLQAKMIDFRVKDWLGYLALAAFITLINSSLEEYYWRWFAFKRLADLGIPVAAGFVSSFAFMFHHGVVLSHYLPSETFWSAPTLFSVMTGLGGGIWCFLYQKTGTLWSAWISHVFVDAAIMLVGADILFGIFGQL